MIYHVVINGEAKGTLSASEAAALGISNKTPVWHLRLDLSRLLTSNQQYRQYIN